MNKDRWMIATLIMMIEYAEEQAMDGVAGALIEAAERVSPLVACRTAPEAVSPRAPMLRVV
ncbi:hypothetical protein LAZ40_14930 [Cereibacter sphaeroides]|uniref:hypothetical protein n=1 Tax=Rhodobacterales TaxID=204455 RepID=UPI000BBE1031|nr:MULTISPECIES: hypothetical protein [Paracoccaceae]MCE6953335.1 hypothetical protein [Cereibacter sphaeroides]MCE6960316.1 hypothetical protein [Cereibacter sphaeroides]MCE6969265.1 hypothetical protein [Cereibacter sphaeroides]MCE6975324.1 hypothetical protein [Cereibacter sphaeroides]